eukprot:PITA_30529
MEESVQSSDGSSSNFGRNGREKSPGNSLKVCNMHRKRSSCAGSDGLEASKLNKGVAQYQHCIPGPIDEEDYYGGELHTQKEATNEVECLNHETSDISWTLQHCTPLEFAALSQAMIDIDDLDQALDMSPRSLIRSLQEQHSSPETESVRKQSTQEWRDTGYEREYTTPDSRWSVRDNPIASLSPEIVAKSNNNISGRRRRNMSSAQKKLDDFSSSSLWSSIVDNIESVSSLSPSSDIDLLLGISNKHTEEESLIGPMQVPNKQNANPRVRCPKAKSREADHGSREEISISHQIIGANSFCMTLAKECSFMKHILRGLKWGLMCVPVAMAVIAIKIGGMQGEEHFLVPT